MAVAEKIEFLLREQRGKEIERNPVTDEFRCPSVDVFDSYEWEIFVTGLWRTYFSGYCISGLECMMLDLILRYIDVIRRVEIVIVR